MSLAVNRDTYSDTLVSDNSLEHDEPDIAQQPSTNLEGSSLSHPGVMKCISNVTKEGSSSQLEGLVEIPSVVPRSLASKENHRTTTDSDARRNLYVLGLPYDLTKTGFSKIFSPFGTVMHAVILATVDSSSRRRGFIVMSTHDEARAAMNGLSRKQIKGHTLDISWAVVQRSQGFLDGGDRNAALTVATPFSTPRSNAKSSGGPLNGCWTIALNPATKLLVSNLPTLLFTQVSDLLPLFHPFGSIKNMAILPSPHNTLDNSITALVEYVDISSAVEAKDSLQFQTYAGHLLNVHYVCDNLPHVDLFDTPLHRSVEGCLDPLVAHVLPKSNRVLASHVQGPQLGPRYHKSTNNVLPIAPYPTSIHPASINKGSVLCPPTGSKFIASCPPTHLDSSSTWNQTSNLCRGSYPPIPTFNHSNAASPMVALSHAYNIPFHW